MRNPVSRIGGPRSIAAAVAALVSLTFSAPSQQTGDRPTATAAASTIGKTIIVLDASGSMWGQIEGRHKIEIARDAVAELMDTLPDQLELGLMAYGHRRKSDCTDIELLIPPAHVDRKAFLDVVFDIMPKGKTPLTDAVEQAAEFLAYQENPANVILVSDGIENCDRDPRELARKLAATGIAFKAHIIAFDLTSEDAASIRCLADETGGKFLEARDAATLKDALQIVVTAAAEPVPAEPAAMPAKPELPAEDLTPAVLTVPAEVKAGARFPVSWTGRRKPDDYITIVPKKAEDGVNGNLTYTGKGPPIELLAPVEPGPHEVRYRTGQSGTIVGRADTLVVLAQATLNADAEVTAGAPIEISWEGPGNAGDYITVVPAGAEATAYAHYRHTEVGNPVRLRAADTPGQYEIRYVANQKSAILAQRPIKVIPAVATVKGPAEAPAGSEIAVEWTGPNNPGDFLTIVPDGAKPGSATNYAQTSRGTPVKIQVPDAAGACEIRYVTGNEKKTLAIQAIRSVATSATLEAPDSVVGGSDFPVTWTGPANRGDYITVVPKDAAASVYQSYFNTARAESPRSLKSAETPGEYEIRYITGQDRQILATIPIQVKAATASIKGPDSAIAGTRIAVEWTAPNNSGDIITIVPKGAKENTYTYSAYFTADNAASPGELRAPESAGDYEVRYLTRERRVLASAPVRITAAAATITAPKTAVAGTPVEFTWTGPNNQNDLLTFAPQGEKNRHTDDYFYAHKPRKPIQLRAPEEPGQHEIRYVTSREKKVLAAAVITVQAPEVTLEPPTEAVAGSRIKIAWSGPEERTDDIAILPADDKENRNLGYHYTNTKRGSPAEVEVPETPGKYEVRFINGRNRQTMKAVAMTVKPATATVSGPARAKAGEKIEIRWTGPNHRGDRVGIGKVGGEAKKLDSYCSISRESPEELTAPKTPGQYEIRYVTPLEGRVLARQAIEVVAP